MNNISSSTHKEKNAQHGRPRVTTTLNAFCTIAYPPFGCRQKLRRKLQGGRYGIRLSLGAQENKVYDNVMSDSSRYGVFFYRGSDEAEVCMNVSVATVFVVGIGA